LKFYSNLSNQNAKIGYEYKINRRNILFNHGGNQYHLTLSRVYFHPSLGQLSFMTSTFIHSVIFLVEFRFKYIHSDKTRGQTHTYMKEAIKCQRQWKRQWMQKTVKRKRDREYKCVFHVPLLPIRVFLYWRHRLHASWAGFHSFIRWSSWSNSHLNNIHCNKTGQTHRHRVTDNKHFHLKYKTTRHFTGNANDETSRLFSMKCYMVQTHITQTQFRQKQRNQLRVKGADPRPSLMYFKKAAIHWRSGSQAIPLVFQKICDPLKERINV